MIGYCLQAYSVAVFAADSCTSCDEVPVSMLTKFPLSRLGTDYLGPQ